MCSVICLCLSRLPTSIVKQITLVVAQYSRVDERVVRSSCVTSSNQISVSHKLFEVVCAVWLACKSGYEVW